MLKPFESRQLLRTLPASNHLHHLWVPVRNYNSTLYLSPCAFLQSSGPRVWRVATCSTHALHFRRAFSSDKNEDSISSPSSSHSAVDRAHLHEIYRKWFRWMSLRLVLGLLALVGGVAYAVLLNAEGISEWLKKNTIDLTHGTMHSDEIQHTIVQTTENLITDTLANAELTARVQCWIQSSIVEDPSLHRAVHDAVAKLYANPKIFFNFIFSIFIFYFFNFYYFFLVTGMRSSTARCCRARSSRT